MNERSIFRALKHFVVDNKDLYPLFSGYLTQQSWTDEIIQDVINKLSEILRKELHTIRIAQLFSPLLLELLYRSGNIPDDDSLNSCARHEWFCIALSKLLWKFPEAGRFAKTYFQKSRNLFWRYEGDEHEPPEKKLKTEFPHPYKLLQAAYTFLLFDSSFFKALWSWSVIAPFLNNENIKCRWYAYQCLCQVGGINDRNMSKIVKQTFSDEELLLCIKEESDLSSLWGRKGFSHGILFIKDAMFKSVDFQLSTDVVDICGVLLHKYQEVEPSTFENVVSVPSVQQNLYSLALAVSSFEPVLLQGPVGCGKTLLVEYLAMLTGRVRCENFLKVQLGDHMDSKMLIGTHCCTEVPGQFVFKPGILMKAMTHGHWLLLEDIDSAPMDVISLLIPVLQNKTIMLPGHSSPINAAPGFQLFATRRLLRGQSGSYLEFRTNAEIISNQWRKIMVDPFSKQELTEVMYSKWPELKPIIGRIIDVYSYFSSDVANFKFQDHEPLNMYLHHGRLISTRDLFKFCSRIAEKFDDTKDTAINVFRNGLDCFCENIPDLETKLTAGMSIAVKFNLPPEKARFFCQTYKPAIEDDDGVRIGRAQLAKKPKEMSFTRVVKSTFANTRQSLCLLEKVAVSVLNNEPVLLVGETGTGKTSIVQHLAELTNQKLTVINMSQQSDSVDLLGGFKPVDVNLAIQPVKEEFEKLFPVTMDKKKNATYLQHIANCFYERKYNKLFELMLYGQKNVINFLLKKYSSSGKHLELVGQWRKLGDKIQRLKQQMKQSETTLAFKFIEGALIKAMKNGEWLLLDEINLAEAETLECLAGVLDKDDSTLILLEKGDNQSIKRHPDFHIFACMNPATDIGKKDLPAGVRSRFTEYFMEELTDKNDLAILVQEYLKNLSLNSSTIGNIVEFYFHVKRLALEKLCDGTGHRPHYSLRTLCRALKYASSNPCHNIPRSLYEAFCLSFLSQLDNPSHSIVTEAIKTKILDHKQLSILRQSIPEPKGGQHVSVSGYWIKGGPLEPQKLDCYIFTNTVKRNLRDLARIVSAGRYPVLLQGETSSGKTSLIQYLAKATGNVCVRVNNHEHTDIQEYIGTYSSDERGTLVFKEGILVEAMKKGYWIILDELNLAPTEVMEALNRVLDDNRELFIAETQTVVKAQPGFMIFATQNPPGLYGGRKILSRAFRNRFVELHFNEIPPPELEVILEKRCSLPASYSKKLVAVMQELQIRRKESGVFAGKHGFITLRDLFRWGDRYQQTLAPETDFYDWYQHLAEEGYLLLAGRVRFKEEAEVIKTVLQTHLKREIDPDKLFNLSSITSPVTKELLENLLNLKLSPPFENIVWTYTMRRLGVLVGKAMQYKEPVLLVGNTGCGKTTICQIYSTLLRKVLYSVNCHMHSESADFLGGLRPVRDAVIRESKLFEWVDGPLIKAMQEGSVFLADEISLADDSVLERLNSVLEPEQKILLSEKSFDCCTESEIIAKSGFQFFATMNPGGDYGKKELSPALRNRFTEIWCPSSMQIESDIVDIVNHSLSTRYNSSKRFNVGKSIVDFLKFFNQTEIGRWMTVTLRDVLTWVEFIKSTCDILSLIDAYFHGAYLVFLDSIGSGPTSNYTSEASNKAKLECVKFLEDQIKDVGTLETVELLFPEFYTTQFGNYRVAPVVYESESALGFGPFSIKMGNLHPNNSSTFNMDVTTAKINAMCILRAMKLPKPILLEGNPGVGKTSVVSALAKAAGYNLVRINLSEQTDISDLFGADLPIEGGGIGEFAWHDGPLLKALKNGDWILLDELNLASQSVLEGLNACLDHRSEIYISELGMTFHVDQTSTRIFGCQNPHRQGGSRKGLPRSFLNRFTQVYVKSMSTHDLEFITLCAYTSIPRKLITVMIAFNSEMDKYVNVRKEFGQDGSPWEFNLRDIIRWCDVVVQSQIDTVYNIGEYVKLIYADRMRTFGDKRCVEQLFVSVCKNIQARLDVPQYIGFSALELNVFEEVVQLGYSSIRRKSRKPVDSRMLAFTTKQLPVLESIMKCIEMNWMPILVGSSCCGKSTLVRMLADITGNTLHVMSVNPEMDTIELLGGFEQVDISRKVELIAQELEIFLKEAILRCVLPLNPKKAAQASIVLSKLLSYLHFLACIKEKTEESSFKRKLQGLLQLIKLLDSIITEEKKQALHNCKKNVEILMRRVDDGIALTGGQFEWVDSVLIHAVVNGHWLLIDDANFCSPSVLDRLNALLEPNGVLTLSEQGTVQNELRIIKPHPDFRIFLSMNPQNGEISRAMRNRGVEIYINPIDTDNWKDNKSKLDLFAIPQCKDLSHSFLIYSLMRIHERLRISFTALDFSMSYFYSAVSLCSQLLYKQDHPKVALFKACENAYARNNFHNSVRNEILKSIDEFLRSVPEVFPDMECPVINLLPTSADFRQHSLLSVLKKNTILFAYLLHDLDISMRRRESSSEDKSFTQYGLVYPSLNFSSLIKITHRFFCVLRIMIESCPVNLQPLLDLWLQHTLNFYIENDFPYSVKQMCCTCMKFKEHLFQVTSSTVASELKILVQEMMSCAEFTDVRNEELPIDPRWKHYVYKRVLHQMKLKPNNNDAEEIIEEKISSYANKYHLSLFLKCQEFASASSFKEGVLKLSQTEEILRLTEDQKSLKFRILSYIPNFLCTAKSMLENMLNNPLPIITDDLFWSFHEVLYSLFICFQVMDICIQTSLQSIDRQVTTLICHIYSLWKKIMQLCSTDNEITASKKLFKDFNSIDQLLKSELPEKSIGFKVAKKIGFPLGYVNDMEAKLFLSAHQIFKATNLVTRLKDPKPNPDELKLIVANQKIHSDILSSHLFSSLMKKDNPENTTILDYSKELADVEKIKLQLKDANLMTDDDDDIMEICQTPLKVPNISTIELTYKINSYPLWEYIFILCEADILCKKIPVLDPLFDLWNSKSAPVDCQFILNISGEILGLNPKHITQIFRILKSEKKEAFASNLKEFLQHTREGFSSHALRCLEFMSPLKSTHNNSNDQSNLESSSTVESWKKNYAWSKQAPLLTYICSSMFVKPTNSYSLMCNTPLEVCHETHIQLQTVKCILWENFNRLVDPSHSFLVSNALLIIKWFNTIMQSMAEIAEMKDKLKLESKESIIEIFETLGMNSLFITEGGANLIDLTFDGIANLRKEIKEFSANLEPQFVLSTSKCYIYVGMLSSILLMPRNFIDPALKCRIKYESLVIKGRDLNCEFMMREWMNNVTSGQDIKDISTANFHPYINGLICTVHETESKTDKLRKKYIYRGSDDKFDIIKEEMSNYLSDMGSPDVLISIVSRVDSMYNSLVEDKKSFSIELIQKIDHICNNQQEMISQMAEKYPLYEDITLPFCLGVEEVIYGLRMLSQYASKKEMSGIFKLKEFHSISDFLHYLIAFTDVNSNTLGMATFLLNDSNMEVLKTLLHLCNLPPIMITKLTYKLLKSTILELTNGAKLIKNHSERNVYDLLSSAMIAFKHLWEAWNHQDLQAKLKKEEEESLFAHKAKHHENEISDEEVINRRLQSFFPSFEQDYSDYIKPDDGLNETSKCNGMDDHSLNSDEAHFTAEEMFEISQLYLSAMSILSPEISNNGNHSFDINQDSYDYFIAYFLRHEVVCEIIKYLGFKLEASLDNKLIPGLLITSDKLQKTLTTKKTAFDVYHDSNPNQIINMCPILKQLKKKAVHFLKEHGENPHLDDIIKLVGRILSFPVTDPVMKFVFGLEMLVEPLRLWIQFAPSKFSLNFEKEEIVKLILYYRALELNQWKEALNYVIHQQKVNCSKWWFHMYNIFQSKTSEKKDYDIMINVLKQCLEDSPLGEFPERLKIVHSFLLEFQFLHLNNKKSDKTKEMLFNIYNFYKQFLPEVNKKILEIRAPVEKEIKDFVKLSRWGDSNEIAVKRSTEKSHRCVVKHMKQFEDALKIPAKRIFTLPVKPESEEMNKWSLDVKASDFVTKNNGKINVNLFAERKEPVLQKVPMYYKKAKKLSKKVGGNLKLISHINILNDFCGNIAETFESVSFEVQKKVCTRSQEKKQALSLIQNKKQLLATLFKNLRVMGLSYRQGIIYMRQKKENDVLTVPAFDLNQLKTLRYDKHFRKLLTRSSQDIDHYFYKCVAQHNLLQTSMNSPNKDLTLDIVNRIQGYSGHLMNLSLLQRRQILDTSKAIDKIGLFLGTISVLQTDSFTKDLIPFPPLQDYNSLEDSSCDMLTRVMTVVSQFGLLLDCAPDPSNMQYSMYLQNDSKHGEILISSLRRSQPNWSKIMKAVKECLSLAEKCSHLMCNNASLLPTWGQYSSVINIFHTLKSTVENFLCVIGDAGFNMKQCVIGDIHSLYSSICSLYERMNLVKTKYEMKQVNSSTTDNNKNNRILHLIQKLLKEVLFSYQDMLKLCTSNIENDSPGNHMVPENLFTLKISKSISDMETGLHIKNILVLVEKLEKRILQSQNSHDYMSTSESLRLLTHLSPLLKQYYQLVKIYFASTLGMHRTSCKLLSILLTIFQTLATKGFCIPTDLQEEAEKAGSTKFEDIESGGLGEGEGTKDVSENIETEDQLEDTFKEGQEKEEKKEDSEIKEEDKGIEMSEDFEGKSYNPENKEEPGNSDEESEDEDLDKKMGDVDGDETEKLDEKVWGDDPEDDDEELADDGETGGVSQKEQSELVAKDGQEKDDDYSNKKDQKEEQPSDTQNEDQYEGEYPDPLIDAPPDKEPEVVEIPDDLEIQDDEKQDDGSSSEDDMEMMEADDMNEAGDEASSGDEVQMSEDEDTINQDQDEEADTNENTENADSAEPFNEEDNNIEKSNEDRRFPTDTPTTEDKALATADQNKSSNDPTQSNEMDWESNVPKSDDQHKEGDAETTNAADQAHEGKQLSSAKQRSGEDQLHKRRRKPAENRTVDEHASKENIKHRPIADKQQQQKSLGDEADENEEADVYEHVSKEEEGVTQSVDVATKEQAAIKPVNTECENESDSDQEIIDISSSDEENNVSKLQGDARNKSKQQRPGNQGDTREDDDQMDTIEGEIVQTQTVPRGLESNLYTQHQLWASMSKKEIQEQRSKMEKDLDLYNRTSKGDNKLNPTCQWEKYEKLSSGLAYQLCEQLRLVLEPTKMAKLKGDYRTGKRLNMRKIIPYIASQFRKDKIWLRRTKPSKRQYQIMLAVDDSSSMADNHSKQLTFETLAVLGQSLSLLEAGELGVVSFGEKVELLLGFNEVFDINAGAKIFQQFTFSQQKTDIAQLLQYTTNAMVQARNTGVQVSKETAQLLVILSDGRGIFSLGESEVRQAVRRCKDNNIFMVFIIIDSPLNKDSILDIKSTEFGKDGVTFKPYIENFPFPFYIILREIAALPVVLGEALRQWFELVTSTER